MEQLAIVAGVDSEAALVAESLSGHIYLMDNNVSGGSTGQGTENLVTAVDGMQILNWLVAGLDWRIPVALGGISGEAVEKGVMAPQKFFSPDLGPGTGEWWGAMVGSTKPGQYSYTLNLLVGGDPRTTPPTPPTPMSFDSTVNLKRGFSNAPAALLAWNLAAEGGQAVVAAGDSA